MISITETHRPLGPVVCISPWNFPLAIFTGQIAAALAAERQRAGKTSRADPADCRAGHQHSSGSRRAGGRDSSCCRRPWCETVGAKLTSDNRVRSVMFTSSTEVASLLQRNVAHPSGCAGPSYAAHRPKPAG